ncbi:unnamed protein product [Urochloa humidicola]
MTTTNPPSWMMKRTRTAHGGRAAGSRSCSRDWTNLGGEGPAGLIAELALASDVANYVRFRAVCRPWRRCTMDPRDAGLDGRYHPRQWLMLDKAHAGLHRHRFLNVSTGECIRMDILELAEHTLLAVTPEGLLLLLHEPTVVVRLLNPLTRQLTDLPLVTALLTEQQRARRSEGELGKRLSVSSGVVLADDVSFTVALYFRFPTVVAVAKPGDERWTLVSNANSYMDSALPFAGRLYFAIGTSIMVLSNLGSRSPQQQLQPELVTAIERRRSLRFDRMSDTLHLLDNAGEMLMVHRATRLDKDTEDERYKVEYAVYRVDLDGELFCFVFSIFC